jgi:acyl-CoA synthetase (AMP-forming)/AMP-acid ligase II
MSIATADRAQTTPDRPALCDERGVITWKQLDSILNRGTNALLAAGLKPDERVAVFAENSAEMVQGHLSGILAGISTVPINFHLTAPELQYILEDSKAGVLLVGPETVEVGVEAAAAAGVSRVVGWRCPADSGVVPWEEFLDRGADEEPPTDRKPRPFLHYTSGTTGRPKGTETPPTMFAGGETIAEHIEKVRSNPQVAAEVVSMVVSPLYHTGPLGSVRGVAAGQTLVILGRFNAEKVLEAIDTHGVMTTMMVPTHFQRLLALPEEVRGRYDVSSVKLIAHTGAACPVEVKRQMIDWFGPVLFEAYGATEAGSTNVITSQEWLEHPGSVGKTIPPFECLILDEDGNPVPAGQEGQIYFRDTTGRGIIYHNDREKTQAAHLTPGVFTLGEVGYLDPEGYLFITDRSSDMVVSGGVNIYPAETEKVLLDHPAIADCAVIGVPNAEMGEELKALVQLLEGASEPARDELDRFCRDALAGYKCPRSYEFVPDVGRNSMGKINKRKLRAPYWPTDRSIG